MLYHKIGEISAQYNSNLNLSKLHSETLKQHCKKLQVLGLVHLTVAASTFMAASGGRIHLSTESRMKFGTFTVNSTTLYGGAILWTIRAT